MEEVQVASQAINTRVTAFVGNIKDIQSFMSKAATIVNGVVKNLKMIREIIDKTKTTIDIDDTGIVKIFGTPESDLDRAINWVKILAGQIEVNSLHNGIIRRVVDFGMFVELVPGQDGLLHVSAFPRDKQSSFMRDYKPGDEIKVQVTNYDKETGRIRLGLKK